MGKLLSIFVCLIAFTSISFSQKFITGDKVKANANLNVRSTAAGTLIGTQLASAQGTVTNGPVTASLTGTSYVWYQVSWPSSPTSGWSVEGGLDKVAVSPAISSVSPNPLQWNSDPHTITIYGSNFVSGCTVTLNDLTNGGTYPKSVSFINSSQLQLSAYFTNNTATWSAQVTSPTASNTVQFQVQAKVIAPVISSITPDPLTYTSSADIITINGSNFVSGCTVTLWDVTNNQGPYLKSVTFVSSAQIKVTANFTNNTATWSAQVTSPTASNTVQFQVQAKVIAPVISSITPAPLTYTSSADVITINGSNFVSGCTVTLWDVTNNQGPYLKSVTFVSSSLIKVTANFTNNTATWSAQVTAPTASNTVQFQVQSSSSSLSLTFPLHYNSWTPYTALITTVFDHSMSTRYCPDDKVIAFTGEIGNVKDLVEPKISVACGDLYSFKKSDGTSFVITGIGNYVGTQQTGSTTLNYDGHPGYDYPVPIGTDVFAAADGQVVVVDDIDNDGSGKYVRIKHVNNYYSQYLHLNEILVLMGGFVTKGQLIAKSGNTGGVAAHLHFEIKINDVSVDPYGWQGSGSDPYTSATNINLWNVGAGTLQQISDYSDQLSQTYKIPSVIIKAVLEMETIGWDQSAVGPDGGIGLMQVTPAVFPTFPYIPLGYIINGISQGSNTFKTDTSSETIDLNRLSNDWRYNLEIGVRILLTKKVISGGAGDDASILENWYYPLAYYNGVGNSSTNKRCDFVNIANNNPSNLYYSRTISGNNSNFKNKSIFPYQECVFNIIANLYTIPSNRASYFGPAIKVTLPGPSAVQNGDGHFDYVSTQFGFFDWSIYKTDGTVQIGEWGINSNECNNVKTTKPGILFHQVSYGVPLPVELVSFVATNKTYAINLFWQTETEINNYGFEIERRTENSDFTKIGFVEGNGTSNVPHSYTFTDKIQSNGKILYRLKQIDRDGAFKYYGPVEVSVSAPTKFSLEQNYPNPFNPSTTLSYGLPNNSNVSLTIYNVLGQQVASLVQGEQNAGWQRVTWNANISTGLYFYRLEAVDVANPNNRFMQVKKMFLLR